jgi:HAD superfamily hydrolase (TIGR01509 family)
MRFDAILFDFDGVLIESEAAGNRHLSAYLSALGHPITPTETMARFMGLAGTDFRTAVEGHIGRPLPADFHAAREAEEVRALADGIEEVAGAVAFVRALPAELPVAVASSSPTYWIEAHLRHLGLLDRFAGHISSGREHVAKGKPAPDIYWHAAAGLGVPIERCAILEDSPVGVTGAAKSGAFVIGLCAGGHCPADHGARLGGLGADVVAADFGEVAAALGL